MVVGPTNENPLPLSALLSAIDSSDVVGTSATVMGTGVFFGWCDHMKSTRPPSERNAIVAAAFFIVAWILPDFG